VCAGVIWSAVTLFDYGLTMGGPLDLIVMPPNARAGLAILGVMALLFVLHLFTGPHEIRKPVWDLSAENSVTSNKDP
jgi:hypothetical protein